MQSEKDLWRGHTRPASATFLFALGALHDFDPARKRRDHPASGRWGEEDLELVGVVDGRHQVVGLDRCRRVHVADLVDRFHDAQSDIYTHGRSRV